MLRMIQFRGYEKRLFLAILLLLSGNLIAVTHASDSVATYRLDTGDEISIKVFNEPNLSMTVRVDEAGTIVYPFLGDITLRGATIGEIRELLTHRLQGDYLVNPEISVSITKYRPFFVNGEVRSPGSYAYQPGINVYQAISLAGGFAERASKGKIFLIPEDNRQIRRKVELDSPVGPGDTITVEQSWF